jgi:hypothetical protein
VFIPACVALRRLWRLMPWILLLPLYYSLVSVAAWRGLWEMAIAPFRWNKTSHGLARTSRRTVSEAPGQAGSHQIVEHGAAITPPQKAARGHQAQNRSRDKA